MASLFRGRKLFHSSSVRAEGRKLPTITARWHIINILTNPERPVRLYLEHSNSSLFLEMSPGHCDSVSCGSNSLTEDTFRMQMGNVFQNKLSSSSVAVTDQHLPHKSFSST